MSNSIAIPANSNSNFHGAHSLSLNLAARSLPRSASGLYVPVHRRGASTSSTSSSSSGSFFERGSLSPVARPTNPRMRSVSPMPRSPRSPRAFSNRDLDAPPAPAPRAANIPLASMIPNTYSITDLLALSSAPARLSPPQCAQLDAHIPLMTRKPKESKSSSPSSAPSSSASSSPTSPTVSLPAPAPAPMPVAKSNQNQNPDAQKIRRRRPGRKSSGGKPRLAPTDVEDRRRRHGANWGWAAHAGAGVGNAPERDRSWRSHAVAVTVAA